MPFLERFLDKISPEPNSGCWLWTGAVHEHGYGHFRVGKSNKKAHRYAFECVNGAVPEGLFLDHKCRVRGCVNPSHLEVVTHQENVRRGNADYNKNKTHCPKGHPYSGQNLYVAPKSGDRLCRTCRREIDKQQWIKKKSKRID